MSTIYIGRTKMANLLLEAETEEALETRRIHFGSRPIGFERFLDLAQNRFVELVDGVIVENPMVQLDHELCSRWLYQVMGLYAQRLDLGEMLSSRIMVKTENFGGRMPDLLFVRKENLQIVQQRAVYGAPDLIIEIVSPNDRPSDLRSLEADYYRLGVPELMFIQLSKKEVRTLRRTEEGYTELIIREGLVSFASMPELKLEASWILEHPRPDPFIFLTEHFKLNPAE